MTITDNFEGRRGYHVSPEYKYLESDVAELLAYTRALEAERRWISMAKRIEVLRQAVANYGMRKVAREVGLSTSTVSRFCNGRETSLSNYLKLDAWQPLLGAPT